MIEVINNNPSVRRFGQHILFPGVPTQVPLDFLARFGVPKGVQVDLSSIKESLPVEDEGHPLFDWYSFLSNVEGYGRHAIGLIRGLTRAGARMRIHDLHWVPAEFVPLDIKHLAARGALDSTPARIGVTFTLGYDPSTFCHPSPNKIAITQFETTRLPRRHAENLNRVDHVMVTSSFNVDVFRKSGVRTPISIMRPGIEVSEFPLVERQDDGLFKVLILGALTERKDPIGAIRIFQRASGGNPDWRLTIKTRAHVDATKRVMAAIGNDRRIRMINRDDPPDMVKRFYADHNCLLWPSRGEGVGLPPLEAMCTGMELVCSDNSGMSDYLDREWSYPIKMAGTESACTAGGFSQEYVDGYGDVGEWWVPDYDHAARQLERCFNNWREGKGKGRRAAEVVRERFTTDHSAQDILAVVGSLC